MKPYITVQQAEQMADDYMARLNMYSGEIQTTPTRRSTMTFEEIQQTIEQSADDYMRRVSERHPDMPSTLREVYITGMYAMMGIMNNISK